MKFKLFAALLALAASTTAQAVAYRYSWQVHAGPYFSTPEEVCIWARRLFPPTTPTV